MSLNELSDDLLDIPDDEAHSATIHGHTDRWWHILCKHTDK